MRKSEKGNEEVKELLTTAEALAACSAAGVTITYQGLKEAGRQYGFTLTEGRPMRFDPDGLAAYLRHKTAPDVPEGHLTVKEAAARVNRSPRTLLDDIRRGRLKAFTLEHRTWDRVKHFVKLSEVEALYGPRFIIKDDKRSAKR